MIRGLNHITIAVSDLERSIVFYRELLGFKGHVKWASGAYLSAGDLWLCLSCDEPRPSQDYTHIALDIEAADFSDFCKRAKSAGIRQWKENSSEGRSVYILDPDGHRLEIHVGSLLSRLEVLKKEPYKGLTWL
ncbi:fosfomycin resistance glutathione transferase [Celerinatantimonas sp. YJH-8]|uniref:fosfomycin resistance glutathione transferase n=1 Tax=Celerinatantimonas sp. YJH-8 TaxID=3228714 RepID=UPI0038C14DF5